MISAQRITRRFGSRAVVDEVSFEVSKSEIVALLGPNGAGKTTTMRMLAGLIAPTSGAIVIDGVALTRATSAALRARIGFLTESPGLWDRLTVRENLGTYAALYGLAEPDRAIDRAIDVFQLSGQASTRAAELSKGMRQKVALARALLHHEQVAIAAFKSSGNLRRAATSCQTSSSLLEAPKDGMPVMRIPFETIHSSSPSERA